MFQKSYPPGAPQREENLHSYWKKIWISLFLPDYCYQTVEISIHSVGKVSTQPEQAHSRVSANR